MKDADVPDAIKCFLSVKEDHDGGVWVGGPGGSGIGFVVHTL